MSEDASPADPFVDDAHPSAMLDRARTLRLALLELEDLSAVFAAVEALSDDEVRMIVLELGFDAWWQRQDRGQSG